MSSIALNSKRKWGLLLTFTAIPAIVVIGLIAFIIGMAILSSVKDEQNYGDITLSEFGANEIPVEFVPIYQAAGDKYGINWILLAAIHRVETTFSTNLGVSSAGAIGHTQFMKCTWIGWSYPACSKSSLGNANIGENVYTNLAIIEQHNGYGVDADGDGKADPMNIEDSIHATAKYLAANMSKGMEGAVYTYNHADWYVDEVMNYFSLYSSSYQPVDGRLISIKGDKAWPVPHTKNVTSEFGMRWGKPHKGIDIAGGNVLGTPIVAFMEGEVVYSQWNTGGYGYLVVIQHANNMKTYYAHQEKQGIAVGTHVRAGQTIGYIGNTGDSKGAHLHFEIRINDSPVNPRPYIAEWIEEI